VHFILLLPAYFLLFFFLYFILFFFFFFFFSSRRRHTRSKRDWSSDVCSSDLFLSGLPPGPVISEFGEIKVQTRIEGGSIWVARRSEERRVGKECRSRWWRDQ